MGTLSQAVAPPRGLTTSFSVRLHLQLGREDVGRSAASCITSLHNSALTAGSADLQRALTSQGATKRDTRGTTVSEPL